MQKHLLNWCMMETQVTDLSWRIKISDFRKMHLYFYWDKRWRQECFSMLKAHILSWNERYLMLPPCFCTDSFVFSTDVSERFLFLCERLQFSCCHKKQTVTEVQCVHRKTLSLVFMSHSHCYFICKVWVKIWIPSTSLSSLFTNVWQNINHVGVLLYSSVHICGFIFHQGSHFMMKT